MPFPDVDRAPTENNSCRTPNEDARAALLQRITGLSGHFLLPDRVPLRAAAVAYLGLCRFKTAHDAKEDARMLQECKDWVELFQPETSGKGVNCAAFNGDAKHLDHTTLITNATRFYMPTVQSGKRRALILLAVGSRFDDKHDKRPPDDLWIRDYVFR